MKTVTLPIEEYEELVQCQKDKQRLMEEIETNADKRGYLVRYIMNFWRKNDKNGWNAEYETVREKSTLKIISKDEVLKEAQNEIDRLTKLAEELAMKNTTLAKENNNLKNRGFFARLFNKED